jgi:hypothetical protein
MLPCFSMFSPEKSGHLLPVLIVANANDWVPGPYSAPNFQAPVPSPAQHRKVLRFRHLDHFDESCIATFVTST